MELTSSGGRQVFTCYLRVVFLRNLYMSTYTCGYTSGKKATPVGARKPTCKGQAKEEMERVMRLKEKQK